MACPHLIIRYKKIVEVMKKAICILASAFLLSGGAVFAQGEMDAYKFSQYDLSAEVEKVLREEVRNGRSFWCIRW